MIVKSADQVKTVFKTIARAHEFKRVELCRRGIVFNNCLLKFFRSKEWIDNYIAKCKTEGVGQPSRTFVELCGCTMRIAMPKLGDVYTDLSSICKDTVEDDAVWIVLWDYFLHAAKTNDIYLEDNLTSRVLVAKAGSTEESILIGLDLAGFKAELDT